MRKDDAQTIIKNYTLWSLGAGLIPLPVADMVVVMRLQMSMIDELAMLYAHTPKARGFFQYSGKTFVASLTGASAARVTASLARSAVKLIPGVGDVIGGLLMAPLAGASTYALGQVIVAELERPGDETEVDFKRAKRDFQRYLQEGRKLVMRWRKQTPALSPMDELEHLAWLLDQNIITQHDFERAKPKLLAKL
ncbi:MAG: DUF697 domain-containing protein [Deinococcota bacterium]